MHGHSFNFLFPIEKKNPHIYESGTLHTTYCPCPDIYLHPFPWDLSDWQSMLWYPELEQSRRACTHRNGVTNQRHFIPETTTHSSGFPWYADLNWNTCTYCFLGPRTRLPLSLSRLPRAELYNYVRGHDLNTYEFAGARYVLLLGLTRTPSVSRFLTLHWAYQKKKKVRSNKMRVKKPPDCHKCIYSTLNKRVSDGI